MTKQREPSHRFGLVPHREIAKELGVAIGSVQTIERRAIQKFKAELARRGIALQDVLPSFGE
uniref:hypothetical protein n=1 Tax=Orrella sp. TaxID=1921583 RepID=UPI0040482806